MLFVRILLSPSTFLPPTGLTNPRHTDVTPLQTPKGITEGIWDLSRGVFEGRTSLFVRVSYFGESFRTKRSVLFPFPFPFPTGLLSFCKIIMSWMRYLPFFLVVALTIMSSRHVSQLKGGGDVGWDDSRLPDSSLDWKVGSSLSSSTTSLRVRSYHSHLRSSSPLF